MGNKDWIPWAIGVVAVWFVWSHPQILQQVQNTISGHRAYGDE